MTRRLPLVCATVVATLLLQSRAGLAQMGPVVGPVVRAADPTLSPENGVRVGEGVILHTGVGVEGGYDTNVFYNDNDKVGSSVMRVTPFVGLTNTARSGEIPSGLFFDSRLSLTYREYFSSESDVTRLRAFTPALNASLEHNSRGTLAVGLTESYARLQDAPYTRGRGQQMIIRNSNTAAAHLRWAPGGGRLQGLIRYTNTLDIFETEGLKSTNSIGHEGMLDLSWRWLPKTALYLQVRQGYITYLNDLPAAGLKEFKSTSMPLRAVLGIRGLITDKTSISLAFGYQNAFYAQGSSTSGFLGSTTAAGELVIMPLMSTRITVGGRHDFQNSVIGNFYYGDGGYASIAQQTVAKLVGQLWGSYEHRRYYGLPAGLAGGSTSRTDDLVQAGALLDYYLKSWAYAGISYTLARNTSDAVTAASVPGVNYTKHLIFARLGVTY
jgi:hypothetical protein